MYTYTYVVFYIQIQTHTQIWQFFRTDLNYKKQKVLGVRLEAVKGLRPSTIGFVLKKAKDGNYGALGVQRDFLDNSVKETICKVCVIMEIEQGCVIDRWHICLPVLCILSLASMHGFQYASLNITL